MSALANAQSFRASIDGVELHWTERGSGPPLVVLHGLSDSQLTWSPVSARLAQRYRVLGLDLPGCGASGRPDASYSLDWQARVVSSWLDHVGLETCDVVGHSYGGGVAMWLLLYRATSIRKLALVAPGGLGLKVCRWLRLAALFGFIEPGGQRLIGPITRLLTHRHGHLLSAEDRESLCRMNSLPGTGRAFGRTVRDVINWRGQSRLFSQRAHEIRQLPSIALFWGERDRVIPISQGEALCAALEHCSLWRLPNAGHFLHWQAPHALAGALLAYLDAPTLTPAILRTVPRSAERTEPHEPVRSGPGSRCTGKARRIGALADAPQHAPSRPEAAHTMHAAAGRRRR
jgi:pimeloyl-ACP methyl ester carboxylesterase